MGDLLFLLVFAHFLADYPLQGPFLSQAKNKFDPIENVPWYQAMIAHASIHGGFVGVLTGQWWLGVLETVSHFIIDYFKCKGVLDYNTDQIIHILCKVTWLFLLIITTT